MFETLGLDASPPKKGKSGARRDKVKGSKGLRGQPRDKSRAVNGKGKNGKPAGKTSYNDRVKPTKGGDIRMNAAVDTCITSFLDTFITNEGNAVYNDVLTAFRQHFPLLGREDVMEPTYLGRKLKAWYEEKYNTELVRRQKHKGTRATQPFRDLGINAVSAVDLTLVNEAKVVLRRSLKMEGVGILVKKAASGEYAVAAVVPGSPGDRVGKVEAGDIIIKVDNQEVASLPPQELANLVLGPRGSKISITLRRNALQGTGDEELSRTFTVTLKRSDKSVQGSKINELETAERYRDELAQQYTRSK
mmetsp:Transcript_30384/g.47599  ORF Transcript_30384/g.47599 Transcript_30384/m.47599 type:complete len:304 (+) Transcript_30384:438-1349(+)